MFTYIHDTCFMCFSRLTASFISPTLWFLRLLWSRRDLDGRVSQRSGCRWLKWVGVDSKRTDESAKRSREDCVASWCDQKRFALLDDDQLNDENPEWPSRAVRVLPASSGHVDGNPGLPWFIIGESSQAHAFACGEIGRPLLMKKVNSSFNDEN